MSDSFRLFDFNIPDVSEDTSSDSDNSGPNMDKRLYNIQMFGLNEKGETCSLMVENYTPFFYVKVSDKWNEQIKRKFLSYIIGRIGHFYEESIISCKIIKRHKLYGFDANKLHKFIEFKFKNISTFNKVKYIWYKAGKVVPFNFQNTNTVLYEANIPPLLRYFHIKNISPSGWIQIPQKYIKESFDKSTTCTYEYSIEFEDVIPLDNKETPVPYKICSFDIEASSSHGDFPLAKKNYRKLATNIVDYIKNNNLKIIKELLHSLLLTAFQFEDKHSNYIDYIYIKNKSFTIEEFEKIYNVWISTIIEKSIDSDNNDQITSYFIDEEDNESFHGQKYSTNEYKNVYELLLDDQCSYDEKITKLTHSMRIFPQVEGDKVTFIGSTFMRYGDDEPYLNHCVVLDTCDKNVDSNTVIEECKTEREVLLKWKEIILKENPDVIIGYNIFGFDYDFMFKRSLETNCHHDFLQMSRNEGEYSYKTDYETGEIKIEESKIVLASGEHNLKYIQMNGRIQIDLYNYFRRDFTLPSYKLDYVASQFISDDVKSQKLIKVGTKTYTDIYTSNMTGLHVGSYVNFEESSHSTEYYKDGAKFTITKINYDKKCFRIQGNEKLDLTKKVKWGLAKDDVTPQDIFNLTKGSSSDRAIIAKYCIQDCNLVQYLMNKIDVITGYIEMAKICSVPINFLVMRGQGIKLTSFIAKKCREKNTLMPVIQKKENDDGYEGAMVLDPKCNLYLDNPVACVDYASLYPSSMISENLSHDSKVWTKEFDLNNNLIYEEGDKDVQGNFIYDNLPNYKYIDITYDVYKYKRPGPNRAAIKTKTGTKICRWAQFPEGKAIMPSILEELLAARKATRKLIKTESDEFMKNILDKRQLSYKLTANSLYGQCGARTSTFYEKDVAASTTATGRMLLNYAKCIIEDVYGNTICETENYGKVKSNAEYIYGDTDSVFFTFNLKDYETEEPITGKKALEITIELAQQAGEMASKFLKNPHDLEYEKTFMPFCLLSKKRYVGMLYETDVNKCKQKSMGIVLKRRDNAPIVKDIYGGVIDILMKEQNIDKAITFLKSCLSDIQNEKYSMDKLIISKSLRSNYKNPQQIAHKVLADRIAERDPGNKPSSGDRIPFAYIKAGTKALQGDRIETPTYIRDKNLKIDYEFYITNQIMKPVQQVFSLVLERIPSFKRKMLSFNKYNRQIKEWEETLPKDKSDKKIEDYRNKEVKKLLFDDTLNKIKQKGSNTLVSYFNKHM
jgi:DNA polymerase elongation subunit (family B)